MDKKVMSFVVVVSTALSVFIMLYSTYSLKETIFDANKEKTEILAEQDNLVIEEPKKGSSDLDNKDRGTANSVNQKKENSQIIKKESQKEKESSKDKEKPPLKGESASNVSEDKHKEEVLKKEIKETKDKDKNSCPVFSVQKESIPDKLTISEKGKLFHISNKLSAIDYGKLMEYINQDDDEKAVRDSLKLLKTRLSKKDYEEIKNIMKRFVNNIEEFEKINS